MRAPSRRPLAAAVLAAALVLLARCSDGADDADADADADAATSTDGVRVVQLGAPGEENRELTPEEIAELEVPEGEEFDRLFLQSMVNHHLGAVGMVEDPLSAEDGGQDGGQDAGVFRLAQHIDSDQRIEISRMEQMLAELDAR